MYGVLYVVLLVVRQEERNNLVRNLLLHLDIQGSICPLMAVAFHRQVMLNNPSNPSNPHSILAAHLQPLVSSLWVTTA